MLGELTSASHFGAENIPMRHMGLMVTLVPSKFLANQKTRGIIFHV
jgi:hypothetical protein